MDLRAIEDTKIKCAKVFFDRVNDGQNLNNVKYDVVNSYDKLIELIGVI